MLYVRDGPEAANEERGVGRKDGGRVRESRRVNSPCARD